MATVSPFSLKYSAIFLALLRARSITALSFWLTWMATLCCALGVDLLALAWADGLLSARTGAPARPGATMAAATMTARVRGRAILMRCSLGDLRSGRGVLRHQIRQETLSYAPDVATPEPKSAKNVKSRRASRLGVLGQRARAPWLALIRGGVNDTRAAPPAVWRWAFPGIPVGATVHGRPGRLNSPWRGRPDRLGLARGAPLSRVAGRSGQSPPARFRRRCGA